MKVGFIQLRDLNDGQFYSVTKSQWRLDLLGYKISMTVGFAGLRDLNDSKTNRHWDLVTE